MRIVIVSGFFNPLHGGHLDMIEAARNMGEKLLVIVNNDIQQIMKKDKIILDEQNRMRLMAALSAVDEVVLSIDDDPGQSKTLRKLRLAYPNDELVFANGGDRNSAKTLPKNEAMTCIECNITAVFGVGSHEVEKRDSSTRINQALGHSK